MSRLLDRARAIRLANAPRAAYVPLAVLETAPDVDRAYLRRLTRYQPPATATAADSAYDWVRDVDGLMDDIRTAVCPVCGPTLFNGPGVPVAPLPARQAGSYQPAPADSATALLVADDRHRAELTWAKLYGALLGFTTAGLGMMAVAVAVTLVPPSWTPATAPALPPSLRLSPPATAPRPPAPAPATAPRRGWTRDHV